MFSAGIASTLGLTFIIAYAGPAGPLPLLELSLVPLAVVFWILASSTPAGDRWTLASVAIWVTAGMIAWFGPTLFW